MCRVMSNPPVFRNVEKVWRWGMRGLGLWLEQSSSGSPGVQMHRCFGPPKATFSIGVACTNTPAASYLHYSLPLILSPGFQHLQLPPLRLFLPLSHYPSSSFELKGISSIAFSSCNPLSRLARHAVPQVSAGSPGRQRLRRHGPGKFHGSRDRQFTLRGHVRLTSCFQEDPAAAAADEPGFSAPDAAPLNADIKAVFPDSDILGIKLVNGRPTNAVIEVDNHEEGGIQVAFVSGNLLSTKPQAEDAPSWKSIVRNLTAVQYNVQVPAGEKRSLPFSFAFDAMPQDVTVQLNAVVISDKGNIFQVPVFEDKAAIVDPPVSFLDPQM